MSNEFFQRLKKEHQGVKEILGQLDKTTEKGSKKRADLFLKLRTALVPHMKAEESSFYEPLLAKKKLARDAALEAIEEHHVAEMVFAELSELPKEEERWGAKLSVFKEIVEHHIKEEETTVFKSARESMSGEEIQAIGERFDLEKQRIERDLSGLRSGRSE